MPEYVHAKAYRIALVSGGYLQVFHLESQVLTDGVVWDIANILRVAADNMVNPPSGWGPFTAQVESYAEGLGTPVPEPS